MFKKFPKLKNKTYFWRGILAIVLAMIGLGLFVFKAQAAEPVQDGVGEVETAINMMWVMVAGAFVFFMQAGFALVETGFTSRLGAHTRDVERFWYQSGRACGCADIGRCGGLAHRIT
jgi:hypothetical protein